MDEARWDLNSQHPNKGLSLGMMSMAAPSLPPGRGR